MIEIRKPDPIRIDSEKKRFKEHIDYGGNDRIIFSGIYGIGKTYFLNKFFEKNVDYEAFYLKPVNYSVSSNKDIFEYIKYDIAFELLSTCTDLQKTQVSKELATQQYIYENKISLISSFLKNTGSIGKNISGIIDSVMELSKKIDTFKQEIEVDDKDELIKYGELFTENKGSIYEENFITQLIKSLVDTYTQKKVLVIDDFDRIDPEHIFRLLNVFAAHNDFNGSDKNKFGFDKIIIVCDIKNIENIYHSKYGDNVEFNGYIDKFYSMEIFDFNNKFEIIKSVDNILRTIDSEERIAGNDDQYYATSIAEYILKTMIDCNAINLRCLLKYSYKPYVKELYYGNYEKCKFVNKYIVGVVVFEFLASILGSDSNLHKAISKCKFSNKHAKNKIEDIQDLYDYFMVLADYSQFLNSSENSLKYNKISYTISTERSQGKAEVNIKGLSLSDLDINNFIIASFNGYKSLRR